MIEDLNRIINTINNKDWNKLEKIRYAYLELGKIIHKDSMFFYTIQNNLLNDGKSKLQYSPDRINQIINSENYFNYYVVCRTSAEMLKYIFDNCNIESKIIKTVNSDIFIKDNKEVEIKHFFLAAKDDNNTYFMTLNPDLPNIQIGSKTSHFANNIEYTTITKNKETNENIKIQNYEGIEIKHKVLTDEEIKEIDKKIGYNFTTVYDDNSNSYNEEYTNYFFELLKKSYLTNDYYLNLLSRTTDFYFDFINILNGDIKNKDLKNRKLTKEEKDNICLNFNIKDKTKEDFDEIKKFLLISIVRLYNKFNIELNNNKLDIYNNYIQNKEYDKIFIEFKEELFKKIDPKSINNMGIFNPLQNMKEIIRFYKTIDNISNKNINELEFEKTKKLFYQGINEISRQFIDEKYLPTNREILSNTYISKKIMLSFNQIFDIGNKTIFNKLELAEQITIVKEMLEIILQDIKLNKNVLFYDENKTAVMNRIFSTVIFDKITEEPYYLIYVKNNKLSKEQYSGNIPIIFDMKENKLITNISLTDILSKYYVIKDVNMKLIIEDIEKDELKK